MSFVDQMESEVRPISEAMEALYKSNTEKLGGKGASAGAILGTALHLWIEAGGTEEQAHALISTVAGVLKAKAAFDASTKEKAL